MTPLKCLMMLKITIICLQTFFLKFENPQKMFMNRQTFLLFFILYEEIELLLKVDIYIYI